MGTGYPAGVETAGFELGSSASSFQILARLAKGGMAELFLARATSAAGVARFVVLKRVLRERAHDFRFLQMFLEEARLAAQLQHPNIAQVYEVGRLGDSYFFTMEYVHGESVRAVLQRSTQAQRPVPLACVLSIVAGAAAGLHHAHDRIGIDGKPLGIVHRDVSPSNLMVGYEGHVKVVDFGVAKATASENLTSSGTVKGKISYLSPEQAIGKPLDRRSDVFSLGIVFWELLTGQRLYKRDSDFLAMRAIVDDPPRPPSSLRSDVPGAIDAVVLRALAKDPAERYQTAHELHEAIELAAQTIGSSITSAVLARYLLDLFGPRPEPWRALHRHTLLSSVTLTAQPIPPKHALPETSAADAQLSSVVDLRTAATVDDRRTARYVVVDASGVERPLPPVRAFRPLWLIVPAIAIGAVAAIVIAFSSDVPLAATARVEIADAAPALDAAPIAIARDAAIERVVIDAAPVARDKPVFVPARPAPKRPPTDRERFAACVAKLSSPADCVVVACRLQQAESARAWFARVPASKRARVRTSCGKILAPAGPNCDVDPSRCQF